MTRATCHIRYDGFCSAFPDVDAHFGSRGSFFDVFGREGYLEQTINVEVLICEVNNAASRRWVRAGRSAPPLSGAGGAPGATDGR